MLDCLRTARQTMIGTDRPTYGIRDLRGPGWEWTPGTRGQSTYAVSLIRDVHLLGPDWIE